MKKRLFHFVIDTTARMIDYLPDTIDCLKYVILIINYK